MLLLARTLRQNAIYRQCSYVVLYAFDTSISGYANTYQRTLKSSVKIAQKTRQVKRVRCPSVDGHVTSMWQALRAASVDSPIYINRHSQAAEHLETFRQISQGLHDDDDAVGREYFFVVVGRTLVIVQRIPARSTIV